MTRTSGIRRTCSRKFCRGLGPERVWGLSVLLFSSCIFSAYAYDRNSPVYQTPDHPTVAEGFPCLEGDLHICMPNACELDPTDVRLQRRDRLKLPLTHFTCAERVYLHCRFCRAIVTQTHTGKVGCVSSCPICDSDPPQHCEHIHIQSQIGYPREYRTRESHTAISTRHSAVLPSTSEITHPWSSPGVHVALMTPTP